MSWFLILLLNSKRSPIVIPVIKKVSSRPHVEECLSLPNRYISVGTAKRSIDLMISEIIITANLKDIQQPDLLLFVFKEVNYFFVLSNFWFCCLQKFFNKLLLLFRIRLSVSQLEEKVKKQINYKNQLYFLKNYSIKIPNKIK